MQTLLVAAFDPKSTFQFNSRAVPQALKKLAATEPGGATLKKLLVPRLRDQSPRDSRVDVVLLHVDRRHRPRPKWNNR